jgi:hypothetical protein
MFLTHTALSSADLIENGGDGICGVRVLLEEHPESGWSAVKLWRFGEQSQFIVKNH